MTTIANMPPNYVAATDCLKDRVILVTGATGSIGRIAALTFAKHGATVILHGRRQSKLDALYDEIEAAGGAAPANILLDLLKAKEADFKGMAETIFATFKRCDGIFHAASHMEPLAPLAFQDLTSWNAHMTVNVTAPVALTRACLPMLKRADNASVIFLTETHAISPKAYWGAFATSKAALTNIATIWNDEVANDSSLRFKLLLPGPIASQMRAMSHPGEHPSEQLHVESIAPAVLYLIADTATNRTDSPILFQPTPSRD
jgi:NAD(P)-dependent dehydrogenase (short-subunit alcohol dehydrogenase family)